MLGGFFLTILFKFPMALSNIIAGTMKWGVWGSRFTTSQYQSMLQACIDAGITTIDHADIYGHYTTEADFGAALAGQPALRQSIQLITKCGIKMVTPNRPQHTIKHYDTGKQHILQSVENSLQNLHTDYIDVLLLHRPHPLLHPAEIAEAFTQLKQQGKVLAFGVSNFTSSQMALVHEQYPIAYNQLELSILNLPPFTDGTLDYCLAHKIVPMAWGPLGGGNIFTSQTERHQRIVAVAEMLAQQYHAAADQILLAWLLHHPAGILPVLGTAKAERLQPAADAVSIQLTTQDWYLLWRASMGQEVP